MARQLKPIDPKSTEAREVREKFRENVNMSPSQIERWLETDASKSVGQAEESGSTVGRRSAKRIIQVKRKRVSELTALDLAHMKKVNGYIARHLEQRPDQPAEELRESAWGHSLKNWGHDPLT